MFIMMDTAMSPFIDLPNDLQYSFVVSPAFDALTTSVPLALPPMLSYVETILDHAQHGPLIDDPAIPPSDPVAESQYLIHALCFQHKRTDEMAAKFQSVGVDPAAIHFYDGVPFTDPRLQSANGVAKLMHMAKCNSSSDFVPNDSITRSWSLCYGHLDMIRHYYDRTAGMESPPLGIFCEDDILLRRDFVPQMNRIVRDFHALKLDIMMLGYLCSFPIQPSNQFHRLEPESDTTTFQYFRYPSDIWGTQMFMMTREHAGTLLANYEYGYVEYTIAHPNILPHFSADWILTKPVLATSSLATASLATSSLATASLATASLATSSLATSSLATSSLALLYPPMAIEDGKARYDHGGQQRTRDMCFQLCYSEDVFGKVI